MVVKAWKLCQLVVENNEACSNFLPGDLGQGKERIRAVEGVKMGPELLLLTDQMLQRDQEELQSALS